jgi:hypothetical protein
MDRAPGAVAWRAIPSTNFWAKMKRFDFIGLESRL